MGTYGGSPANSAYDSVYGNIVKFGLIENVDIDGKIFSPNTWRGWISLWNSVHTFSNKCVFPMEIEVENLEFWKITGTFKSRDKNRIW